MSLVNTNWLEKNLDKVKIIDCSWHMPQTKRNGFNEYRQLHIENAIFFDLDKNSKIDTDLPHMLTDIKCWKEIAENVIEKMNLNLSGKVVTKSSLLKNYSPAEEYHQRYLEKR